MFVVLFEVEPYAARTQDYLQFGKLLRPELEQIDGFIDNERFASTPSSARILSLSTWRDEKALIRWRTHATHHSVQEQGRNLVFSGYTLRVGEVCFDSAPPPGQSLQQQRFDVTQSSNVRYVTLLEYSAEQADSPLAQLQANPAYSSFERFTSLYQPGKQIISIGWSDEASAQAWLADCVQPQLDAGPRCRMLRIIRSYGLRDRDEAPQYYPAVPAQF
jgi:Uncharacterized enzyme involved in biosynthesis of extracellular polysaccharides